MNFPDIVTNDSVPKQTVYCIGIPPRGEVFNSVDEYYEWLARHSFVMKNVGGSE